MQPNDEFAVIVAGVVSANQFTLIGVDGTPAAVFGSSSGDSVLVFNHYDIMYPGLTSELRWTQGQNGAENITLRGPRSQSGAGDEPLLILENFTTGGAGSAATIAAANYRAAVAAYESTGFPNGRVDITTAQGDVSISSTANINFGASIRTKFTGASFATIFDSDPWVTLTLGLANGAGGLVIGTAPRELRGARIGRGWQGTWVYLADGTTNWGVAGGQIQVSGFPNPRALQPGPGRIIGGGFVYDSSANVLTHVDVLWTPAFIPILMANGGSGNGITTTVPYVLAVNDQINLELDYELA